MTTDATKLPSAMDRSPASGGPLQLADLVQSFASVGPLVRLPFRANGERLFVVSDEKLTAEEMRAEVIGLLDEVVASSLLNLVTAMRLADSGDLDLHDVFDPDERELLMKGWRSLRPDRRQRIIERACNLVTMRVLLDIDERMMRRRIEVAVARALEEAGACKAA